MSLALTDDHAALADTARRWVDSVVGAPGVRAGIDDDPVAAFAHWNAMVDMGWPALHGPEEFGGQGFALADLAIVLEECGRGLVPGPLIPTALAVAVLCESAPSSWRDDWLRRLSAGETAAVGLHPGDGGSFASILGARGAALTIVPTTEGWQGYDAAQVSIVDETGIDLMRPVATIEVAGPGMAIEIETDRVHDLATLVLAAEAIGVGAWCVETASSYARERVQFGRPIGQFQGVKHRCADMLASLELARAITWDALRGGESDEERLAIAAVGAIVPASIVEIAKDCVQVLGGIGFTWEHDAHIALRRMVATKALLPSATTRQAEVATAVAAGVQRRLPVELPEAAEAIRPKVAAWIAALKERPGTEWNTVVADEGYLAPHWPRPWGRGASAVEQVVIDQEFTAAGVRRPHLQVAAWALPTLLAHGTSEQQDRWMGPSLRQEIMWCQLFSEPEAGSDLAALQMKAIRDGDGWRLTGQKVWTSMAHTADWGICLARTSPDKPNHDGITCFFVDMRTPGIEVRPLREINGDAWFNEVFFDAVFVPGDCVIGTVDDGWRAGRTTLANERVSMGSGASIGAGVLALVEVLDDRASDHDRANVGRLLARDAALTALRRRMTIRSLAGADAGPEASVVKLLGVLHDQDVQEAGVELLGPAAASATGEAQGWVSAFLWNRSLTIAGGTSEVQRNVIGERLLGLPRDV